MKKILKLIFILSLLTIAFVACKKDKGEQSADSNQSETNQGYDGYQQVLYVNAAKFNISGDMVVLFSEEIEKITSDIADDYNTLRNLFSSDLL